MMHWMNATRGDLRDQWDKVSDDKVLADVFNLIQSAVRSRVGECVCVVLELTMVSPARVQYPLQYFRYITEIGTD
jgi:hypothetical protein